MTAVDWVAPESLDEALAVKTEQGDEATVVAGGTFLSVLIDQRLLQPTCLVALRGVPGLDAIAVAGDELHLGAMTTHRDVETSSAVGAGWPALARAFSLVATPRVRNQATVGGVLADADYASDPPAMLAALRARAVVRCARGEREVEIGELVTGYYETSLQPDELLVGVRVPRAERAVYRKFRSRSHEDRPCVAVAAATVGGETRVVVGAVAATPQHFPDLCRLGDPIEVGRAYAETIEPISDVRGTAAYRRRVVAVEVRRALEELRA